MSRHEPGETEGEAADDAPDRRRPGADSTPRTGERFQFEEEVDLRTGEVYELRCDEDLGAGVAVAQETA